MESSDISHKTFVQISDMCKNYSRSRGKVGKNFQEPYSRNIRGNTPSSGGVTRMELGNLWRILKLTS